MFRALLLCLTLTLPPGQVSRVVDGDTFDLYHVGTPPRERVRLLGVDAAESRDTLGPAATAFVQAWLARGSFTVEACKRDNFGRLLAWVYRGGDSLHVALISARLGVR